MQAPTGGHQPGGNHPDDHRHPPQPGQPDRRQGRPEDEGRPLPPVKITAAKGGDQTVPPIKGKIAAAIKASGKSLNAISREHGLNPSQLRRLVLDQVAKVDLVRAEAIAQALGKPLGDLFGEAADKAKATPKATARRSRAAKA